MKLLLIGVFGVLGVYARYFIQQGFSRSWESPFPTGTFVINLLGSFLIGLLLAVFAARSSLSQDLKVALGVGFLGGFTTFSAYSFESLQLFQEARYTVLALYWVGSPVLGLLATLGGWELGKLV